ncbi:hypothetical protein [Mycobacteroides abscessus]|uniref:hypothetical protein n=1 Tax=Mycobacteroides abscessus TaxID=36809 RepID=UPI000C26B1F4|nr:hypothetical protein [Mycobacteroides abscessus]
MSLDLLVVLLALLVAASAGLLLSAAVLGWLNERADQQRTHQRIATHRQRQVAIRRTQHQAEQRIDQLTMDALASMVAATQKADRA